MSSAQNAGHNVLLAALPRSDHKRVFRHLKPVSLSFGEILFEPGKPMARVYFPVTGLISLLTLVDDHRESSWLPRVL